MATTDRHDTMTMPSETRFEELKRYVLFSEQDAAALASFRPVAEPHFARIARALYERTRGHAEALAVFRDEAQIARHQLVLVQWLRRLCGGTYDEAYYQETLVIGRVHVRVELPQRYMLTAMSLLRLELSLVAEREMAETGFEVRCALTKVLDLELAIMLESYHDDSVARLQQAERDEKAQLSRTLARTEHRYLHAVKKAQVLIVGFNTGGQIRLFNLGAERLTSLSCEAASSRTFDDLFVRDEDRDLYRASIRSSLEHGEGASFLLESSLDTTAGKERVLRWHVSYAPVQSEDEDVTFFAIGRDVTDEKALSERSRRHEKLAAVGTLAAGLAHEIRNPLNGAQLHLSFLRRALQKGDVTAEVIEAATVVGDEIKRLAALVTEFLDFARPRPLVRKPASMTELCERALSLVAPDAEAAGVSLVADLPSHDVMLVADRGKLEQVILNLLRNAIEELSTCAEGRVTLRARQQPHRVLIEVEDNGAGIPRDAPVFDAFFTTKPQGTGLGLSISHRIVTDHGGEMTVDSHPGRTLFRLCLPLEPSSDPALV